MSLDTSAPGRSPHPGTHTALAPAHHTGADSGFSFGTLLVPVALLALAVAVLAARRFRRR